MRRKQSELTGFEARFKTTRGKRRRTISAYGTVFFEIPSESLSGLTARDTISKLRDLGAARICPRYVRTL